VDALTPIWNQLLVWPIEGALLSLTAFTASAGLAIIVFTVVVRTLMLPLGLQQIKSQRAMLQLQPHLAELQRRYASDKQRLGQETMKLYKEHGVNPIAGCLPLVLQMPIWFALYSALINLSSAERDVAAFQASFLWIPNLAHPSTVQPDNPVTWPQVILPLLTAFTQWVVQRMSTMPSSDPQQRQMSRMMEFMPLMFLVFSFQVASGLVLYWVVSNLYSIAQQRFTTGWGTLPILGTPLPAVQPGPDGRSTDNSRRPSPSTSRGRRAPGPSGRRRKGR
jgi:YidC/Oxa1 family membrane protein insertase